MPCSVPEYGYNTRVKRASKQPNEGYETMTNAQAQFSNLTQQHILFIKQYGFISFSIEVEADLNLPFNSDVEELCRIVRQS
jgi:hypothetical protein